MFVGIDPGSKQSGVAVWRLTSDDVREGLFFMVLEHRGEVIHRKMQARYRFRHRRRTQNLRYRPHRAKNRLWKKDWLPPSFQHRVDTVQGWVSRLALWAPVAGVELELVRFDTQKMQAPEMSGVEYQQGALAGFEVREYLLAKWGRQCAYCDARGVPLEVEHVVPRSAGGSDRVSNLTLACRSCNQRKTGLPVSVFLAGDVARLRRITSKLKTPLKDIAAVNTTRWALLRALEKQHIVHTGTGAATKWNRTRAGLLKEHYLDALCVGDPAVFVGAVVGDEVRVLRVKCAGRGQYQRTKPDKYGFPRTHLTRVKSHYGFATGDLVKAVVPKGKNQGTHTGRVRVRATGVFDIVTRGGVVAGVSHRFCVVVQRGAGFGFAWE